MKAIDRTYRNYSSDLLVVADVYLLETTNRTDQHLSNCCHGLLMYLDEDAVALIWDRALHIGAAVFLELSATHGERSALSKVLPRVADMNAERLR